MPESYLYFYILNSKNKSETEEILIDFKELKEFDDLLNELPEYQPSDSVLENIFKTI
jgi:hypothetical protein